MGIFLTLNKMVVTLFIESTGVPTLLRAEIIPKLPDPDNAGVGR